MSAALQFFPAQNYLCRIGTGTDTYEIVYPFYGVYPGSAPMFNATYSPSWPASPSQIGQFLTLADAQAACQTHFNQLPPPP